jgi:uncharacterized membrane protein YphA (DoxX/SURF4 family)
MNILLWVLQIALALLCLAGGSYKILHFDELQKTMAAMRALPQGLWATLGASECLGGLGLILPAATRVLPVLTPIAAAAVAAESVLVSALYLYYLDFAPLPFTVTMALMAAFIAYGRSARKST